MGFDNLDNRISIGDERKDEIDQEVSGAGSEGFRVRVSLERFFSDERARVVVWAERARPAAWLLRRLRAALPLPPPPRHARADSLALLAGGYLLPPAEPLAVLRPDDLLEVIISPGGAGGAGGERTPAPAPADEESGAEEAQRELAAVKRRALRLLDSVEAAGEGEEVAPGPRRRRRVRRRRIGAVPPASPDSASRWRAEDAGAGAGVLRSATPPRVPRLVAAAAL